MVIILIIILVIMSSCHPLHIMITIASSSSSHHHYYYHHHLDHHLDHYLDHHIIIIIIIFSPKPLPISLIHIIMMNAVVWIIIISNPCHSHYRFFIEIQFEFNRRAPCQRGTILANCFSRCNMASPLQLSSPNCSWDSSSFVVTVWLFQSIIWYSTHLGCSFAFEIKCFWCLFIFWSDVQVRSSQVSSGRPLVMACGPWAVWGTIMVARIPPLSSVGGHSRTPRF